MKKLVMILALALCGFVALNANTTPYNSAAVKKIMQDLMAQSNAINGAINSANWPAVAAGFQAVAGLAQQAASYAAPKGDDKEWQKRWEDLLYTAWRGIGAAGEKSADKAKAALGQLASTRNTGHGQFK